MMSVPEVRELIADITIEVLGGRERVYYQRAYTKPLFKGISRVEVTGWDIEVAAMRVWGPFVERGLARGSYAELVSIVRDIKRRLPKVDNRSKERVA